MEFAHVLVGILFVLICFLFSRKSDNGTKGSDGAGPKAKLPGTILNNYRTLGEVEAGLRKAGLESSDLILAIDFTKSNSWQGEKSFFGQNLHALNLGGGSIESIPTSDWYIGGCIGKEIG